MKSIELSKNGIARQDLQGHSLHEAITRRNGASAIPSEAELDASRAACFANLSPDQDLWIFAYGSRPGIRFSPSMNIVGVACAVSIARSA
jgi:hypothetical protein